MKKRGRVADFSTTQNVDQKEAASNAKPQLGP